MENFKIVHYSSKSSFCFGPMADSSQIQGRFQYSCIFRSSWLGLKIHLQKPSSIERGSQNLDIICMTCKHLYIHGPFIQG
jgi:hypothetical protein